MAVTLLPLGTGPGWPDPELGGTCFLLESGGLRLLLDTGEPCSQSLCQANIDFSSIDAVLISHGHSDHTGGFPLFLQSCWLHKRRRPLHVYLPAELIEPLRAWLNAVYLPESMTGFQLQFLDWESHRSVSFEKDADLIEVQVHPTTHLDSIRSIVAPGQFDKFLAYSMRFETQGTALAWSADIGEPQDLAPLLQNPAATLVCEMAHYKPEALFAWLKGKPIQSLYLHHFPPTLRGKESEVLELGRKMLPDLSRIEVATKGQVIQL